MVTTNSTLIVIEKICSILREEGKLNDRFKPFEVIKYTPSEINRILVDHVDELEAFIYDNIADQSEFTNNLYKRIDVLQYLLKTCTPAEDDFVAGVNAQRREELTVLKSMIKED